jgi:succinate dehydrogenase / fumarate reductase flavoprotein subunit
MQGLSDGYFVISHTLGDYVASNSFDPVDTSHDAFSEAEESAGNRINALLSKGGDKTVLEYHRELGGIMWDKVGMSRNREGLTSAIEEIRTLRGEFWENLRVPGEPNTLNKNLEFAGRVADFLELGELMARDALQREESCGGHFREEHQTEEGEALRDDENFSYVAAWEYTSDSTEANMHKEDLQFERVTPSRRSYK